MNNEEIIERAREIAKNIYDLRKTMNSKGLAIPKQLKNFPYMIKATITIGYYDIAEKHLNLMEKEIKEYTVLVDDKIKQEENENKKYLINLLQKL